MCDYLDSPKIYLVIVIKVIQLVQKKKKNRERKERVQTHPCSSNNVSCQVISKI